MGQSVRFSVLKARAVGYGELEASQQECPVEILLTWIQSLNSLEILQIFVIGKMFKWICCPFQLVLPLFQCQLNSQKLSVTNIAVLFCGGTFFREKCYRVQLGLFAKMLKIVLL